MMVGMNSSNWASLSNIFLRSFPIRLHEVHKLAYTYRKGITRLWSKLHSLFFSGDVPYLYRQLIGRGELCLFLRQYATRDESPERRLLALRAFAPVHTAWCTGQSSRSSFYPLQKGSQSGDPRTVAKLQVPIRHCKADSYMHDSYRQRHDGTSATAGRQPV